MNFPALGVRQIGRAGVVGLLLTSCTLTADLDRFKGDAGADAGPDVAPAVCEKGVDCTGCQACESFCQCGAVPSAYDLCVAKCIDAGS